MNKKIISVLSIVVIVVVAGAYLLISNKSDNIANEDLSNVPDIPDIDLSLSPLGVAELPSVDLGEQINLDDFNMDIPEINLDAEDISINDSSDVDISFTDSDFSNMDFGSIGDGYGSGSGSSGVNKTNCSKFSSAPSCSYVPAQYQDLCNQCKSAGY